MNNQILRAKVGERHSVHRAGFSLLWQVSLSQKPPGNYEEKLVGFQQHVIKVRKNVCQLVYIGNADQAPVCPDMTSVQQESVLEELVNRPFRNRAISNALYDTENDCV